MYAVPPAGSLCREAKIETTGGSQGQRAEIPGTIDGDPGGNGVVIPPIDIPGLIIGLQPVSHIGAQGGAHGSH